MNKKNTTLRAYYNKTRGKWWVPFPIKDTKTNQEKIYKKYFETEEIANEEIKQFEYKKKNKIYIENNGIPIYKLMEAINESKFKNGRVEIGQYGDNSRKIEKIANSDIGKKDISEITTEDLEDYFCTLKNYSKSYMDKWISQFSQAFRYAERQRLIDINPMYSVTIPKATKEEKKVRALEIEEQKTLTEYLTKKSVKEVQYKNVFFIQIYMGLRIGEVLALEVEDFDFNKNMLHVKRTLKRGGKGGYYVGKSTKTPAGIRDIPIPQKIKPFIEEQIKISKDNNNKLGLLFINKNKNIVSPQNANSALERIVWHLLKVDDISTHSLRHTFGTRCIEAGVSPVVVQRLMGHDSIEITMNEYVDVLKKFKDDELKKLLKFYNKNEMFNSKNDEIDFEL